MKKKIDDAGLSAPDTKAGRLQRACLVLLRQHERDGAIPTNGRFLFYELEQQGVIPKAYLDASGRKRARQPAQDISDATMRLRELGLVPWWWIVDETREVTTWRVAASVYEYIMDSVEDARIDCWGGKLAPLILCEARATKGVVERITGDYLCPIAATGGQSGGFIVNEIVPLLAGNERMVLYIGDCEVDGPADQIEAATRRRIEQHTGRTFTAGLVAGRAHERASQTQPAPAAARNRQDRPPLQAARPYKAIECEAVGQVVLERMLRDRLDALLPEPLDDVLVREQRQRAKVRAALAKLKR